MTSDPGNTRAISILADLLDPDFSGPIPMGGIDLGAFISAITMMLTSTLHSIAIAQGEEPGDYLRMITMMIRSEALSTPPTPQAVAAPTSDDESDTGSIALLHTSRGSFANLGDIAEFGFTMADGLEQRPADEHLAGFRQFLSSMARMAMRSTEECEGDHDH
ncbi:hypothetical protein [Frankia sp. Cr1]|uniref:hypothetical protein n=1 Tax=Frankia sp. Cr1 TaxID=3073931 RepID=UPI002AD56D89|nr:hypothetical protein [Frankia sp. Cr1]